MTAEEAALIVALIGVTGTLAANVLTTRANRRGAAIDELRRRTADAFREAFLIQHALEWVTWHARNDPEALTGEMKQEYATEVHRAFPALLGAMAGTAALSIDVYQRLQPILQALYDAEEKVALALRVVDAPGPGRDNRSSSSGRSSMRPNGCTETCQCGSPRSWPSLRTFRRRLTPSSRRPPSQSHRARQADRDHGFSRWARALRLPLRPRSDTGSARDIAAGHVCRSNGHVGPRTRRPDFCGGFRWPPFRPQGWATRLTSVALVGLARGPARSLCARCRRGLP